MPMPNNNRMAHHMQSQSMHQAPINLPPIYNNSPQNPNSNKALSHHIKSPSLGQNQSFFNNQQQLNQSINRLERVVSNQNEIIQHLIQNNSSFMHDPSRNPSSRQGMKPLNLNHSVNHIKPLNLNTSVHHHEDSITNRSYGNTPTHSSNLFF